MANEKILIVEGDPFFRDFYRDLLKEEGHTVALASSGSEALDLVSQNDYHVVVTDLVLGEASGLEILSAVQRRDPAVYVIMVTDHADVETARRSLKNGATDYLVKPINRDEFRHIVNQCLEQRRLLDENLELKEQLNLYRVSQNIANCLDLDQIYPLMMEALAREIGVTRGLGYFCEGGPLRLREVKGVDGPKAALYGEMALARCDRDGESGNLGMIDRLPPDDFGLDVDQAMYLALRHKSTLHGMLILFNDPGEPFPTRINRKNLGFLLDQCALALENAARYHFAKDLLYIDELTGLNNYRYLDVVLERELRRMERYGSELSVLFMDIDHFKVVNDNYGHLVGSRVLTELGTLVRRHVRDVDAVIRYGGDEFTVVLVETGAVGAALVAERIRSRVEAQVFDGDNGESIKLTVSLGYACAPEDARNKADLLELSDKAMYRGKASGKNKVFHIDAAAPQDA